MCHALAAVDGAVFQEHGFHLRSTQLLALCIFLEGGGEGDEERGVLEQVRDLILHELAFVRLLFII